MTPRLRRLLSCIVVCTAACASPQNNPDQAQAVDREAVAPEKFLIAGMDARTDSASLTLPAHYFDTDEEAQPDTLPSLPLGMSLEQIRDGDRIFHDKGGCVNCHGTEAQGLAARGKSLTTGVAFVPTGDWNAIDSLVSVGMPDALTRSPIAMPARGQHGDLDASETRTVAAYIWAISQTRGEPWAGGHSRHGVHDWRASSRTSIP
jgi:mono/diheme cytochrome c family protein